MAESETGHVPINVVILPDNNVANKAMTYSWRITRHFPGEFTLDSQYRPHITVVQGEYPENVIPDMVARLEEIAETSRPLAINMEHFIVSPNNFLHWTVKQSDALLALHDRVVHGVRDLGVIQEEYKPHITLTKLKKPDQAKEILKRLDEYDPQTFIANTMSVMDLGEFGTVSTMRADMPFLL